MLEVDAVLGIDDNLIVTLLLEGGFVMIELIAQVALVDEVHITILQLIILILALLIEFMQKIIMTELVVVWLDIILKQIHYEIKLV